MKKKNYMTILLIGFMIFIFLAIPVFARRRTTSTATPAVAATPTPTSAPPARGLVALYLPAGTGDQTAQFQSLINQSVPYGTIVVRSGTHYFGSTVDQPVDHLTITCESGAQLLKLLSSSVSLLDGRGNYCTYNNLYIDSANRPEPDMRLFGSNNQIYNSTFRNSVHSGLLVHISRVRCIADFCPAHGQKFYHSSNPGRFKSCTVKQAVQPFFDPHRTRNRSYDSYTHQTR
ncbi:MAG: hypothetical protein JXJ04_05500 [Spirochaetales bacterium]|nr:hypothetical protein [Spirochaetales bacterium]